MISGHEPKWEEIKIPMAKGDTLTMIATSFGFAMVATSANRLILWGNNEHGQIGNGKKGGTEQPFTIQVELEVNKTSLNFFEKRKKGLILIDHICGQECQTNGHDGVLRVNQITCNLSNAFALIGRDASVSTFYNFTVCLIQESLKH